MKRFTIEFIFNSDVHNNKFLRLLNTEKYDIEITYGIEDNNACIVSVTASNDFQTYDITDTCKLFFAMDELQYACEFDLTGKLVRQMFENYPRLNDPELAHLRKEEMIKKLDQEESLQPHMPQIKVAINQ